MQLQSGQAEVVVACGTENMTQLPYYLRKARDGYRMGHGELEDGLISIPTWPEGPYHNGITAENVAQRFGITREAMDDFALVEPAEGAEGDRGGSLSRADPGP